MDEVLANNMILIDAYTPAGTIIKVNGVTITSPLNLNNNIPAAPGGDINVVWQVSGSNISAYVPVSGIGSVTAVSAAGIAVATPNPIVGAGTITVAGSGSTLVAATAATNLAAAPSGDVLIADGLGNVKDSGVLLSALALLASPSLSGVPTAPTATFGTNTTQLATTAYVLAAISGSSDVLSVFGRTGAVVAQNGDYTYAQISGTPQLAQTFAPIAGEFLTGYTAATGLFTAATPSYPVTSVFGRTGAVVAASGDYTAAMVGALATSLMTTAGDMIYENATPTAARLPIGATGNVLTVAGGVPVWAAPATSGTVTSFSSGNLSPLFTTSVATPTTTPALTFALNTQTANTAFAGPTTGAAAAPSFRALVTADLPAGTGTVTSFSAGNIGTIVTTSVATATTTPALTFSIATQAANIVWAGPTTGVAAIPTFRALVAADIPALPYGTGTVTSVSAGNIGSIVTTSVATATTTPSITFALATQTANTVWAGPTSGVAATPTFRALVAADIPALPYGTVTSVSFTGGLISVATPTTTPAFTVAGTSGGVVYFNSATTWASSAVLPAGDVMLGGGAGTAPNASSSLSYISSVLSVSGSAVFPTVPVNGIRITPTGNNSGTVEIYGTNATNSASVWSIDQVGNAGFATVQGNTVTGNSANASGTLSIEGLVGSTASIAAMYGNGVTPSSSNFCFAASSASTYLNSVTSDQLQVAGSTILTIASTGTTSTGTLAAPTINATTSYQANGTAGLSAGNFSTVTSITTKFGLVTVLTGAASDERLKTAITPYEGGLDEVLDLSPIRFHWNEEGAKFTGSSLNKEEVGFTAQNVQRVLPEAITYEGNERHLNFRDRPVIALLVNAVKELNAKNVDLEARLERLEELLNVR
jgi:hypothetical protein